VRSPHAPCSNKPAGALIAAILNMYTQVLFPPEEKLVGE
jgi:hypothetical protein